VGRQTSLVVVVAPIIAHVMRYTFGLAGAEEGNLYYRLNEELRSLAAGACDRAAVIRTWAPLLSTLLPALKRLDQHPGILFRGIPESVAHIYTPGKQVRFTGFTSLTTLSVRAWEHAHSRAEGAAECTVLRLHCHSGRKLHGLSCFAHENEVILLPNALFVVSSEPHKASRFSKLFQQMLTATEIDLVELTGDAYQF